MMKKLSFVFFVQLVFLVSSFYGQVLSPGGSIRQPTSQGQLNPMSRENQERQQKIEEINQRTRDREALLKGLPPPNPQHYKVKIPLAIKDNLKITSEEEKTYAESVNDSKAKFVRLWNNVCRDKQSFDASKENCLDKAEYSVASLYSFYLKDYKPYFSDFSIINSEIIVNQEGQFQMLTEIGDVSFDKINDENKQVGTLKSFDLSKVDTEKAKKVFETGFQFYDLKIVKNFKIELNKTYLLRSLFEDKSRTAGFTKVDKITAFRFVNYADGFVTIAWKEVKVK